MSIFQTIQVVFLKYKNTVLIKIKIKCQYYNEAIPYLVDLQLYDAGDKLNV